MSTGPVPLAPTRSKSSEIPIPLEREIGCPFAFGFVLDKKLKLKWGLQLNEESLPELLKEVKTDLERSRLMDALAASINLYLPGYIARQIPELPRFAGRKWNRLGYVTDGNREVRYVFIVKHNGSAAARDLDVPQEVLDKLKEKLGVSADQEPKWYPVVV